MERSPPEEYGDDSSNVYQMTSLEARGDEALGRMALPIYDMSCYRTFKASRIRGSAVSPEAEAFY